MGELSAPSVLFADEGKSAILSGDGLYRYELQRRWRVLPARPLIVWVMLNPSTADADKDDPTIRRVMRFSERWGYAGCVVLNLFAYRATRPTDLVKVGDPVGPQNDAYIDLWANSVSHPPIVCAWGASSPWKGALAQRREALSRIIPATADLRCLGETKGGHPLHPLYQPRTAEPLPWSL